MKKAGHAVFLTLAWKKRVYAAKPCFIGNELHLTEGGGKVKVHSARERASLSELCSG